MGISRINYVNLFQGEVNPSQIGIIAPYRDQVSLLRKSFSKRGVECSTVDQFQGRDKSVIIYSCTKSDEMDEKQVKVSKERFLFLSVYPSTTITNLKLT